MEEAPVHRAVLDHAHGAGVAARQDGLWVLRRQALQAGGDLVERLIPADAFEFSLALLPDPAHRVEQAIGRVSSLEVMRHLGAKRAVGERHRGVALDLCRDAVLHRHEHGAGVGTIVWTGNPDNFADDFSAHAGILRWSASSSSSIQCRTGSRAAPWRWVRQPMFALVIWPGRPSFSAASLRLRSSPAIAGCSSE